MTGYKVNMRDTVGKVDILDDYRVWPAIEAGEVRGYIHLPTGETRRYVLFKKASVWPDGPGPKVPTSVEVLMRARVKHLRVWAESSQVQADYLASQLAEQAKINVK